MKQVTISTPFITLIVLDYGAIIQKLLVKDKKGRSTNVVVGSNYPNNYLEDTVFLGACVGRYAGRISNASFELDRETFPLYGEKGIHLHGGKEGFGKKYWTIEEVDYGTEPFVKLSYYSKHLEEGYPGNLKVMLTYKLVENELHIIHEAAADRTTVINLTNHSYFRLDKTGSIDHYRLELYCPEIVETDRNLLPTGNIVPVTDTEYDFRTERKIGELRLDTPYVKNSKTDLAARIFSRRSGISLEVKTNQPAVVVYTPPDFPAICFETQNYPDAPNHEHFPSCILRPDEIYRNASVFTFDLVL
ncbi:galactose mutarotase [Ulvibacterium marinum]|uniref:Galactose mutarotase n=1 Tax=Ulvibacterium marinum TaxID=2419782 RepID=A0A3B0C8M8_9FLAO|nr:galactose mutarotase [Ulvibacterium marinum]